MAADKKDDTNDPGMVNDDGMYPQQQPLNFDKIWQMFQETDKKFQEIDKRLKETNTKIQEIDKRFKEREMLLKEKSLETSEPFKETERILRRAFKKVGGLGTDFGEAAKEYFFVALQKLPEIAGVRIERLTKQRGTMKDLEREYDVVLFGQDTLIIVEVKHKLETKDVVAFYNKSLPVFKQLFPVYTSCKIIGAVAGMTATPEAVEQALAMGLLVFTQSDQKVRLLNPEGFEPKEF